jgi:hypothetical protein
LPFILEAARSGTGQPRHSRPPGGAGARFWRAIASRPSNRSHLISLPKKAHDGVPPVLRNLLISLPASPRLVSRSEIVS